LDRVLVEDRLERDAAVDRLDDGPETEEQVSIDSDSIFNYLALNVLIF
jgi:hypothetical protein